MTALQSLAEQRGNGSDYPHGEPSLRWPLASLASPVCSLHQAWLSLLFPHLTGGIWLGHWG